MIGHHSVLEETGLQPGSLEALLEHAERPDHGSAFEVRSPMTEDVIGTVPECTAADVDAVARRARSAQAEWASRSVETRAAVIDRFGDLVADHRDFLLDVVQLETGKARRHAVEEVLDVPLACSYYARTGPSELAPTRREPAIPVVTDASVWFDPVGVVGVISPWNYPLTLAITDAIPALLAGNAVVCKPDERTPFSALALASLLDAAGVPDGLFHVVTGDGATVGPAVIDAVDYVAFTGGTETGRTVAAQAGANLVGCSLELGGKNPFVVLDDADVEQAARGAVQGAFTNAGQLCLAPERFYVADSQYEAFVDAFADRTDALSLGLSFDYGPDVGSLIDGDHQERVAAAVDDAVDRGGTVVTGGRRRPDVGPYCYEPTILTDVDPDSEIVREETFGPVVTVEAVPSTQAAIEAANDSPYGLTASVWTGDANRGRAVARELAAGTVCVNDAYVAGWAAVDAPMGGVGASGLGRRHGPEGLRRFVETKTIATSRIGPLDAPPGVPTAWFVRALSGLTRLRRRLLGVTH